MLFNEELHAEEISIPDGELLLITGLFNSEEKQDIYTQLEQEVQWRQDEIKMGGRTLPIPRLQAWYGDAHASYRYSGLLMQPIAWTPLLRSLKLQCEQHAGTEFNSMLANFYRNGNDSVSWHADDEAELGPMPIIACLSFGDTRRFHLKHKHRKDLKSLRLDLEAGTLLIMRGSTQAFWKHQISKTQRPVKGRISLTYRSIKPSKT